MRSRRGMVQIVRRHNFVFDAFIVVREAVLGIVTFENVKIFHLKLVLLTPSDS